MEQSWPPRLFSILREIDSEGNVPTSILNFGNSIEYLSLAEHLAAVEKARREGRAEAFREAAEILFEEAEGDIDFAREMFVTLSRPSSPESIARLEKTIAEQLERAAKASEGASE